MLATHISKEPTLFGIEELTQYNFILFVDAGKLNGVKTQLLEVQKVQIPGHVGQKIVKSDTWGAKETMVVGTDAYFDAVCEKGANRVRPQIVYVSQDLVRSRAAFDTNVLILYHRDQIGMHRQVKAVTNTLRAKQDSIIQLLI